MGIVETSENGDTLETLKELRRKIASTIETTKSGRDIAALSRQLQIVMLKIDELERERAIDDENTVLSMIRKKHQPVRDRRGRAIHATPDDVKNA